MPKQYDMIGKKFNKLTVIERDKNKHKHYYYLCKCECGNKTTVSGNKLRSGHTKSCGCLSKEIHRNRCLTVLKEYNTKHDLSYDKLYGTWRAMMTRCYKETHMHYNNYGGRGIEVCERWKDPRNFIKDMSEKYKEGLTLERINNDKNYEPSNCKWATCEEQNNNKRSNLKITLSGTTKTLSQWCKYYNVKSSTITSRISRGEDICEYLFREAWCK